MLLVVAPPPVHASFFFVFFFNDTATTEIYTLSLHDALPISRRRRHHVERLPPAASRCSIASWNACATSSAWTWCRSSAPRPGTTISSPAERAYQTFGSRFPSGPIGGQPGPLMWPGWSTVVTRPPDRVSAASSSAMAAFRVPYSPNGGGVVLPHRLLDTRPVPPDGPAVDQVPAMPAQRRRQRGR